MTTDITKVPHGSSPTLGTLEQGRAMLGLRQPPKHGAIPVDLGLIRLYCGTIQDANPRYWSDEAALVESPPGMLYTWAFDLPWRPGKPRREPALSVRIPLPGAQLANARQSAEFYDVIRVGDRLSMIETVTDISEEKRTWLGSGHFVTTDADFIRQDGTRVASLRNTLFRYNSDSQQPHTSHPYATDRGRPAAPDGGHELKPISMVVSYLSSALAPAITLDTFPAHYDLNFARAVGHRTVFMNTMVILGLFDRVVTDAFGPGTVIHRHSIQLVRPVYEGASIQVRGVVADSSPSDPLFPLAPGVRTTVNVRIADEAGPCAVGTVTASVAVGAAIHESAAGSGD